MLPQSLQYHPQKRHMFFLGSRIYQNVIYEYDDKTVQERLEHPVHQVHEGRWCISESKRHHQELIITISYPKCYLRHILILDSPLTIT